MKNYLPGRGFGLLTILLFLSLSLLQNSQAKSTNLEVTANFPGGNVKVDSIVGNTVYLRPDLRDTTRDWFYWYLAVKAARTTRVKFVFNQLGCLTRMGPAVSTDKGKNWQWLWKSPLNQNEFEYEVRAGKEIRFSVAMPYTQSNLDTFLKPYKKSKLLKNGVLCHTKKGRLVEKLVLSEGSDPTKPKILITARHHSCEMMVSYIMEGMIATLLTNDSSIRGLLQDVEFVFIPFMDKDGVEDGDQGKARFPRDHNRDYSDSSIHESTRAVRKQFGHDLIVGLDFHCPMLKGKDNESLYLMGNENKKGKQSIKSFASSLITASTGPMKLDEKRIDMSLGGYPEGDTFVEWATGLPSIRLACTVEVPYALHYMEPVTPEKLRVLGKDMVYALQHFLKTD